MIDSELVAEMSLISDTPLQYYLLLSHWDPPFNSYSNPQSL